MHRIPALLVLLILWLPSTAVEPDPAGTDERLAYSTYRTQSGRVALLVDSYAAALHREDDYVPIPVAVGLGGNGKGVTLHLESFTLIDSAGTAHAVAGYRDVRKNYGKLSFDRELIRQHPLVKGQQFDRYHRIETHLSYSLTDREGLRQQRVHLAAYTWFEDVLYFPLPDAGLDGILTLRVSSGDLDEPVTVRFRLPEIVDR